MYIRNKTALTFFNTSNRCEQCQCFWLSPVLRTDTLFPRQQRKKNTKIKNSSTEIFTKGRTHRPTVSLKVGTDHEQLGFVKKISHGQRRKTLSVTRKSQNRDQSNLRLKLSWLHIPQIEIHSKLPESSKGRCFSSRSLCSRKFI